MPRTRPRASSTPIFEGDASAWAPATGLTAAISSNTTGRASPSFTPLSTFSSWRSLAGTSLRPTIAEANTGSVGASTAPTRKDVVQSRPTR